MEENLRSKLGFWLFFLIIIFLLVGGYFYMNYTLNDKRDDNTTSEKVNYKIDTTKDYIYYINESTISEGAEIYYKDVVINLSTQEVLTESLAKENKIYKNNIKYISDDETLNKEIIVYNNDDINYLTFRDYKNYEFGKYISLLVSDYNYSCMDGVTFNKSFAYVFNTENGGLLTSNDLLNMYNLNIDIIKERVKDFLNTKQTKVDDVDLINIDETINELNMNSLYINEYGKLTISYLVKTTQTDYNEITEVN